MRSIYFTFFARVVYSQKYSMYKKSNNVILFYLRNIVWISSVRYLANNEYMQTYLHRNSQRVVDIY